MDESTDHLEPVITDRGFKHLPPIGKNGRVRVYESSDALAPHIWVSLMVSTAAHLTLDEAQQLADQLRWLIDNHYQVQP